MGRRVQKGVEGARKGGGRRGGRGRVEMGRMGVVWGRRCSRRGTMSKRDKRRKRDKKRKRDKRGKGRQNVDFGPKLEWEPKKLP